MPEYPFTDREQNVIREMGKSGFRYKRETKKTIEFEDSAGKIVELNREHGELALVLGFGRKPDVDGRPGVLSVANRSSSNFKALPLGETRTGRENYTGLQVVLRSRDGISDVLKAAGA